MAKRITDEQLATAQKCLDDGGTYKQAAQQSKMSISTIRKYQIRPNYSNNKVLCSVSAIATHGIEVDNNTSPIGVPFTHLDTVNMWCNEVPPPDDLPQVQSLADWRRWGQKLDTDSKNWSIVENHLLSEIGHRIEILFRRGAQPSSGFL